MQMLTLWPGGLIFLLLTSQTTVMARMGNILAKGICSIYFGQFYPREMKLFSLTD